MENHFKSKAISFRSFNGIIFKALLLVQFKNTLGALPYEQASDHHSAHTAQRSPGINPAKLYYFYGVTKSNPFSNE